MAALDFYSMMEWIDETSRLNTRWVRVRVRVKVRVRVRVRVRVTTQP